MRKAKNSWFVRPPCSRYPTDTFTFFRAYISVDRHVWCTSETLINGFWGSIELVWVGRAALFFRQTVKGVGASSVWSSRVSVWEKGQEWSQAASQPSDDFFFCFFHLSLEENNTVLRVIGCAAGNWSWFRLAAWFPTSESATDFFFLSKIRRSD